MKSGYKILWTDHALSELDEVITYIKDKWTERELRNFSNGLEKVLQLVSENRIYFRHQTVSQI